MKVRSGYICTILLTAINVAVFVLLSFEGQTEDARYMLENGAMFTPFYVLRKEYYRIFTSMFLHFGFVHLMSNMVSLVLIGRYLEPVIGSVRFLLVYLASGLAGNYLSLAVEMDTHAYTVSAGASGAIFGIMGSLFALILLNRGMIAGVTREGMLLMIGLNLYNGFSSEGVDNLAHIGGLIAGFLLTILFCWKRYAERGSDRWS